MSGRRIQYDFPGIIQDVCRASGILVAGRVGKSVSSLMRARDFESFLATIFADDPDCLVLRLPDRDSMDLAQDALAKAAAMLRAWKASGDVNCIPMFGKESDSAKLGHALAAVAGPLFERIATRVPKRFLSDSREVDLPLDPVPSAEVLDKEIEEMTAFISALDRQPELEWVLGTNCHSAWPVETKKAHVAPLLQWAVAVKRLIESGKTFPSVWPTHVTSWIVDDLGLVFSSGEPLTEIGLELSARSPLAETLLVSLSNGSDGYLGTDEDRRRGGYETYTSPRYANLADDARPLPYRAGASERLLAGCDAMIRALIAGNASS